MGNDFGLLPKEGTLLKAIPCNQHPKEEKIAPMPRTNGCGCCVQHRMQIVDMIKCGCLSVVKTNLRKLKA